MKQVELLLVASIRERIPNISEQGLLYTTLLAYLEQANMPRSQPDLLLLHSKHEMYGESMSIDVEVAIPLLSSLPGKKLIIVYIVPYSSVKGWEMTEREHYEGTYE